MELQRRLVDDMELTITCVNPNLAWQERGYLHGVII